MKGLILISTVAFSLASFAASASEAPSESVCSLTHLKQVADKEGLDPAGALAKECIGKGYTAAKAFFAEGYAPARKAQFRAMTKQRNSPKTAMKTSRKAPKTLTTRPRTAWLKVPAQLGTDSRKPGLL